MERSWNRQPHRIPAGSIGLPDAAQDALGRPSQIRTPNDRLHFLGDLLANARGQLQVDRENARRGRHAGDLAVWHDYLLADGKHKLRIVVLGEPYPSSDGSNIALTHLVVFR